MSNSSNRSGASRAAPSATPADQVDKLDPPEVKDDAAAPESKPDADAEGASAPLRAEDNTPAGPQPDGTASAAPAGTDPANFEEIEVHTTGEFMLLDPFSGRAIEASGSTKVPRTSFIDAKLDEKQLAEGPEPKADKADDE